jgi:hypothetical protein
MKQKYVLLLVVLALVSFWYYSKGDQKPVSTSVEYFETQDPSFSTLGASETKVTPDQMEKMIQMTQPEVSKQLGKCTYCINTDTVQKVGSTYQIRFMFMVLVGFPYGVGVDAVIAADENGEPVSLVSINIQTDNTIDDIDKFDQFQQASDFSADSLPTLAQLQAVLNKQ